MSFGFRDKKRRVFVILRQSTSKVSSDDFSVYSVKMTISPFELDPSIDRLDCSAKKNIDTVILKVKHNLISAYWNVCVCIDACCLADSWTLCHDFVH